MSDPTGRWSLDDGDARRIEGTLEGFLRESGARCALLVDRNGQLIASAGETRTLDATAFASLAAADFSANDQLASLIGEPEFSSLLHQGEPESMLLADVARRVILVVLFDERATLGMIRIKARGVARELSGVFETVFARASTASMESGWLDDAEDEIDRLFGGL